MITRDEKYNNANHKMREKFFQTLMHNDTGYVPFYFDLCPLLYEKFKEKTGRCDYKEYYKMPMRFCHAQSSIRTEDNVHYAKYHPDAGPEVSYSEWGIGIRQGSVAHFVQMLHPMKNFKTLEEINEYKFPHFEKDYLWEKLKLKVYEHKTKDTVVFASMGATVFEHAWGLRSMEELYCDMYEKPDMANVLFDRIVEYKLLMAEKYVTCGVDGIQFGDDIASQLNLMMSPDMWREYLKPRLKKIIDKVKQLNPDILIEYHSDGNIEKVIPELIECGIDILNPVQPECMDPYRIKQEYGDRLSFRGCVGTQTTMPFSDKNEVYSLCIDIIKKVGKNGGLILSPSHVLEPEVPWENIEAFVEAIEQYNEKQVF